MRNTDQIRENADAARKFKPLTTAEIDRTARRLPRRRPDAVRRLRRPLQPAAGTTAELGDLTRFFTYHEHHGYRAKPPALRRADRRRAQLVRRRPRSRPPGLPQQARLRQTPAPGRSAPGLIRLSQRCPQTTAGLPLSRGDVGRFTAPMRSGVRQWILAFARENCSRRSVTPALQELPASQRPATTTLVARIRRATAFCRWRVRRRNLSSFGTL